ncbi:hypothetical protein B0H13DRAFT_1853252 [Mycena leptocephala]|nr:hypothetical protein B0H13DRAFT_1853252 [Mycena leptocephala]
MAVASDVLPFLIFILNFPGVHSIQGATTTIWRLPPQRLPFSDVRAVFEEQPGSHHHRLPFPAMLSALPPSALPIKKVKIIQSIMYSKSKVTFRTRNATTLDPHGILNEQSASNSTFKFIFGLLIATRSSSFAILRLSFKINYPTLDYAIQHSQIPTQFLLFRISKSHLSLTYGA